MSLSFEECVAVAVAPESVRVHARGTEPPTFGVYRVPASAGGRRYRFGRHPDRHVALTRELGECELVHLFLAREPAEVVARHLNTLPPPSERKAVLRARPAREEAQALALPTGRGDGDTVVHADDAQHPEVATLGPESWERRPGRDGGTRAPGPR